MQEAVESHDHSPPEDMWHVEIKDCLILEKTGLEI